MLRTLIVVGLSALFIGLTLPNIWLPTAGSFDVGVDSQFKVVSVTPGSLVDQAGVRVGDQIDPASTTPVTRVALAGFYLPRVGETFQFDVIRSGVLHHITIRQPAIPTGSFLLGYFKRPTASLFIIVAATLLLMRPSPMLWGFFLFALGSTRGQTLILEFVNPTAAVIGDGISDAVYDILGTLGLLMFATNFPSRSTSGVRPLIQRATPYIVSAVAAGRIPYLLFLLGVPAPTVLRPIGDTITAIAFALGIVALLAGLLESDPGRRQRLRWVVAGFAVYGGAILYQRFANALPGIAWPAAWSNYGITDDVLNALVIVIPLTVSYAVLKHHVLDLNFVIGRGIVYAILTSIAVAIFAIIEWFIGGVLAQTKLATAGEVIAAIAIGFWLNGLHGRVDRFVDATLFRRRHLAERRLAEVAAGLPHAQTSETVATMLVREPTDALGLLSAAHYRRTEDGVFRCDASVGCMPPSEMTAFDGDAFSVRLHGARGPISMRDVGWEKRTTSSADDFVVAMPVFVRHELAAIVLYGPHATGEVIDPDEMRTLQALCNSASAALDHLEAVELRRRLDESERTIAALQVATLPG